MALEDVQVDRLHPGVSVVRFKGEHDLATTDAVSELFESLLVLSDLVVADVSEAQFIDSSMLKVMIDAHKLASSQGKDFRVYLGTEAAVRRTFQISGILEHIGWAHSGDGKPEVPAAIGQHDVSEESDGKAAVG